MLYWASTGLWAVVLVVALIATTGCGQTGDLYYPEPEEEEENKTK